MVIEIGTADSTKILEIKLKEVLKEIKTDSITRNST